MRIAALITLLLVTTFSYAQDTSAIKREPLDDSAVAEGGLKKEAAEVDESKEEQESTEEQKSKEEQERFEKFIKTMKGTVMIGTWTIDGDEETKRREERYEIKRVVKADRGDYWNIFARMKFGGVDATLPFPVEVKWAGSTPVITVDELKLIGMGAAFDARIVIADGKYAGTWRHGKVGGLMYGRIEKAPEKKDQPKVE